jgi:glutamine amidotransferase
LITIIDYGSGNVSAIGNIYERLNIDYKIAKSPSEIIGAHKLFLPGVGAFDETMILLENSGFRKGLDIEVLIKKVPIIGICVGMQVLGGSSDEGKLPGLGYIKGHVKHLDENLLVNKPTLPHMGWNNILLKRQSPLFEDIDTEIGFYFLHSFYFECDNHSDVLATTEYGHSFPSAINHENVYGIQFHPEKSHNNGVSLLKNFAKL